MIKGGLMDPISNQKNVYDFQKFVWQTEPNRWVVNYQATPKKTFNLDPPNKSEKAKKDLEKEKDKEKPKQ